MNKILYIYLNLHKNINPKATNKILFIYLNLHKNSNPKATNMALSKYGYVKKMKILTEISIFGYISSYG